VILAMILGMMLDVILLIVVLGQDLHDFGQDF